MLLLFASQSNNCADALVCRHRLSASVCLAFRYTRWINRRKKRVGHLFQGRYKAFLVDRDAYLLD